MGAPATFPPGPKLQTMRVSNHCPLVVCIATPNLVGCCPGSLCVVTSPMFHVEGVDILGVETWKLHLIIPVIHSVSCSLIYLIFILTPIITFLSSECCLPNILPHIGVVQRVPALVMLVQALVCPPLGCHSELIRPTHFLHISSRRLSPLLTMSHFSSHFIQG